MYSVKKYHSDNVSEWNIFVENAKNSTFLFNRSYMDYHSDRFEDFSLMIYKNDKLVALLPANIKENVVYSHQGLTYGGLVTNKNILTNDVLDIFDSIISFFKENNVRKFIYKPIPHIYHKIPSEEDLYAIFRCGAVLIGRNISSTIIQNNKIKFIESRKSGIRKAVKNNIKIVQSDDFEAFWDILNDNLKNKYGVAPVHNISEIKLLQSRFPNNIVLYMAYKDDTPLGGTVLYIFNNVVHTQYISANLEGKELGVLDLMFDKIINEEFIQYPVFDFGQSTEQMGTVLNENLIFQKEGFGGRGVCYDVYELEIN